MLNKRTKTNFVLVGIILVIQYQLTIPLSMSNSTILRLFTTDKLMVYFIIYTLFKFGLKRVTRVESIHFFIIILLGIVLSNFLNQNSIIFSLRFQKELLLVIYSVFFIVVLSKYENLIIFLKWGFVISSIMIVLSLLRILNVADVLPSTQIANNSMYILESSSLSTGVSAVVDRRLTFLWFDANNFAAYIINPALLIIFALLIFVKEQKKLRLLLLILGFIFLITLIKTISRGGTFSLIGGSIVLFILSIKTVNLKGVISTFLIMGVGIILLFIIVPDNVDILLSRYLKAAGLLSSSGGLAPGGLETGRIDTLSIAVYEFFQKPLFGWGSELRSGSINITANHLGYLIHLGKYGLFGFLFSIILLLVSVRNFFKLKVCINNNSIILYMLFTYILALTVTSLLGGFFHSLSIVQIAGLIIASNESIRGKLKLRN
jgi:hypothetical protein